MIIQYSTSSKRSFSHSARDNFFSDSCNLFSCSANFILDFSNCSWTSVNFPISLTVAPGDGPHSVGMATGKIPGLCFWANGACTLFINDGSACNAGDDCVVISVVGDINNVFVGVGRGWPVGGVWMLSQFCTWGKIVGCFTKTAAEAVCSVAVGKAVVGDGKHLQTQPASWLSGILWVEQGILLVE